MKSERHERILEELSRKSKVHVSRLAADLGVSEPTIRNDLEILAQSGLLTRVHGGAVPVSHASLDNKTGFLVRSREQLEEKLAIARWALRLVKDHDSILLDASSTCYELAKLLAHTNLNLTVTTNGLRTASVLSANPKLRIYVVGGALRNNNAITGLLGSGLLHKIHLHKAFVSVRGIDVSHGLTDFSFEEGELKAFMLAKVREIYALVDHTKLGNVSVVSFCDLSRVTSVITDGFASADQIKMLRSSGAQVVQVPRDNSPLVEQQLIGRYQRDSTVDALEPE